MMDRFIGMVIIVIPEIVARCFLKHIRQVGQNLFTASHQADHPLDIVWHEPSLLVRIGFHAAIALLQTSFFRQRRKNAFLITRTEPSRFRIEDSCIRQGTLVKMSPVALFPQPLGQTGHAPIRIIVFQRAGYIAGRIAVVIIAKAPGGVQSIAVCFLHVIIPNAFPVGITQNRNGRIAHHAAGVSIQELPPFEIFVTTLVGYLHKRVDKIVHHLRVDDGLKRHLATEDIPSAEDRPFTELASLMDLFIRPGVLAIDVAAKARINQRMIKSRVENPLFLVGSSLDGDFRQLVIPKTDTLGMRPVKIEVFHLRRQILLRILQTGIRDTTL